MSVRTLTYHAMTPAGASTLARTMIDKYGAELVQKPKRDPDGRWSFKFRIRLSDDEDVRG